MTARPRNDRGFTLISVLIAITILAIGLMALARTQNLLARTQASTASRAAALAIAQDYLEELRSRDSSLVTESAAAVDENGAAVAGGAYRRAAVVSDDSPTLQRVTVRVDYPGAPGPVELVTLIFRATP